MKLLLICDSLDFIGGVSNYTRPLYKELLAQGVDVSVLSTGTVQKHYSFFRRSGIVRRSEGVYEYFNCPITLTNYGHPESDLENRSMEKEIGRFLDRHAFDVVHIHCMVGMPVSLYRLLSQKGLKVLTTVHEYWWLCPYRVMVDFNNRICDGPEDIRRCAYCIERRGQTKTDARKVAVAKFSKSFPHLHRALFALYRRFKPLPPAGSVSLEFSDLQVPEGFASAKEAPLAARLKGCIEGLNLCRVVIAVSQDVKRILMKYGVDESRILVQHIGSLVAEKVFVHTKQVDERKIQFGFIGGVGFYKGVHQMVQAYLMLPESLRRRASLEIFGKVDAFYQEAIEALVSQEEDQQRIHFYGRFSPDELQGITNRMDLSILPSLCADTAPQTIFESYNAGLPIIAPRVGGFPDFVIDGETGYLYDAADVAGLSSCMAKVIENPAILEELRKKLPATKTMRENAQELRELYNSL